MSAAAAGRICFTIFETTVGWLSKQYWLEADGSVGKSGQTNLAQGNYRRVEFDASDPAPALVEIGQTFEGLSFKQAIGLGVPRDGTITGRITTKDRHAQGDTEAIPRSLEYFGWPDGPGLLLLDGDDIDGLQGVLCKLYPAFARVAFLCRPSASASVIDPRTGKALKTAEHGYVVIDDPTKAKACLLALLRLAWCVGSGKAAGLLKLSKSGAELVRGPVDASVGSPERLSYEGAAVIGAGLDQLPRNAQVIGGGTGMLCAKDLLEYAERHAPELLYNNRVNAAKNDPGFCARRAEVQAAYRTEHIRQAVARGVPREKAEAGYDEALAAGTSKSGNWTFVPLPPERVLYWPDGKSFTIADIQNDRTAFHRKECCDPVEGTTYQSRNCAVIYTNGPRIEIYSRAHGDAFAYVAPLAEVSWAELFAHLREGAGAAAGGTKTDAENDDAALGSDAGAVSTPPLVEAKPFVLRDPKTLLKRQWVYGKHLIRKFGSATFAPSGSGKSNLLIAEALAMATGRALLDIAPPRRARVWYWNGEDPYDELERRVGAACLHYGITAEEIEGWLFINSGRDQGSGVVIATQSRDGVTIAVPVVEALVRTVRGNQIDVVMIDPFISSHQVPENDNNAIDAVAKTWTMIADVTDTAIDLAHHTRKTGGAEVTVEDGRGAVALLNAVRPARVLNVMTEDEAIKAGVIDGRRRYFRVTDGKNNLALPVDKLDWFRSESVYLGNGDPDDPLDRGDNMGVVTAWQWPNPLDGVSGEDFERAVAAIRAGEWRLNNQAKSWVGQAVAKALGLGDVRRKGIDRARVIAMVNTWVYKGVLVVVERQDPVTRKLKEYVEVAENTLNPLLGVRFCDT